MGQKPKTTIEINGKRYDAITGNLVEDSPGPAPKPTPTSQPQPAPTNTGGSIGGMVPGTKIPTRQPAESNAVHPPPKRAHTLHRRAVDPGPPPAASHTTDPANHEPPTPARRQLAHSVDSARLKRSSRHAKSQAIAKFSTGQPAAEEPEETYPAIPAEQAVTSPAISPKEQLIAQQLAKAAANQPPPAEKPPVKERMMRKFKSGRAGSITAVSLAALLLIGYVTYLNVPRMALRVAAGRAGFAAEMPGYVPSGFRFAGPIAYSPGELTLQYASNTDERNYTIREKETSWDSKSLLDNYVTAESELYSTYQERGLTVYVYDGSTATWVNGGIWYTVGGDSELTSEQLLKIAGSL